MADRDSEEDKHIVSSTALVRSGSKQANMRLVVHRGEFQGKVYVIEEGSNLIGRWDPESGAFPEIDLEQEDVEAKVSRKHAVIVRKGAHVTLEDIGSLNGVYLNRGARLPQHVAQELKNGDEIIVGKIFFRFEID